MKTRMFCSETPQKFSYLLLILVVACPGLFAQNGDGKKNQKEMEASVHTLDGMSDSQAEDLYDSVLQRAYFNLGYKQVTDTKPAGAEQLTKYEQLEVQHSKKETRSLLIGLKLYPTKVNELVLRGQSKVKGKKKASNPDLLSLQNFMTGAQKRIKNQNKKYAVDELEVEFFQLTSILPKQCVNILASLGYNTKKPAQGAKIAYQNLPIVYPAPDSQHPTVVSDGQSQLKTPTHAAPQNRLIFLHHRSQGEEIIKLKKHLRQHIDVPARQVLIESMLVELTQEGRRELGIQWQGQNQDFEVISAFQTGTGGQTPLTLSHDVFKDTVGMNEFRANLRALVRDNEAEVLSSPSVLTLNNSQANIEVIEEVPVFNKVFTGNVGSGVVEFNVNFKEVGITLNIKPRISQKSETVTMQIQGEVSEAPLSDFVEVGGEKVAPLINRRKVQTIARVNNNTPFIIGGLIRSTKTHNEDRVPILSKIPLIHPLFKVQEDITERRENIIVLNPRVISPEGSKRPIKPKDSERFDFLNNQLFRNTYRLKSDDVFDLGFIEQNEEIKRLMRRAKQYLEKNPDEAGAPPFDTVKKDQIPGEGSVAVRMLYEIAKKLNLTKKVKLENLIYFDRDKEAPSGFDVEFLKPKLIEEGILDENGNVIDRSYPRKILVLRYNLQPGKDIQQISNTPVANAEVVKVKSRDEAKQILLDGNKLKKYERPQTTFIVDTQDDIERLKAAILVREMISVNDVLLRLDEFRVGRKIMIPEIRKDRIMLIDQDVSEYFYQSEYYYTALKNKLRAYNNGIKKKLGEK